MAGERTRWIGWAQVALAAAAWFLGGFAPMAAAGCGDSAKPKGASEKHKRGDVMPDINIKYTADTPTSFTATVTVSATNQNAGGTMGTTTSSGGSAPDQTCNQGDTTYSVTVTPATASATLTYTNGIHTQKKKVTRTGIARL